MEEYTPSGDPIGSRPDADIEKAEHWTEIGRYDLAEEAALRALASDPDNAEYQVVLGWVYYSSDKHEQAEECANRAIGVDPECARALALLGLVHHARGRNQLSEECFLAALRLEPTHSVYLYQYGALLHSVGEHSKAEKLVRACLEQDPDNSAAHSLLSLVQGERQQSRAARDSGEVAVGLAPDDDFPHYSMGLAYFRSGRLFKAKRHLREAARLDPEDEAVVESYELADWYSRWTAILFYYFGVAVGRIPGAQYTLWGTFVALVFVGPSLGLDPGLVNKIAYFYLAVVIYTWLATPITNLWVKLRPCP
ncbi:MAG: tetratricopeptide repeat protein [Planctomycetota bacterium]